MASAKRAFSSTGNGYEPQTKKQQIFATDAALTDQYIQTYQPGRVPLHRISWLPSNRGGHGILDKLANDIATDISIHGTSKRRYGKVLLVEVPENVTENLLLANEKKALLNPHLSNFENMIRTGTLYATLSSTHFVEAQKLVMEGGRRWMGEQDGTPLQLRENDIEGRLIQTSGVDAVVYRQDLWWDKKAQLALMRLGNLNVPLCVGKLALEKQDL